MKKLIGFLSLLPLLILSWCGMKNNPSLPSDTANTWTIVSNTPDTTDYSGELILAGVWPEISFESTVSQDTLVLKKTFEDHADHVFFPANIRKTLNIQSDLIPWNHFQFAWKVKALDAAAWNHYYEVVVIDSLTKIASPSKDEVLTLIENYNYCEKDSDCSSTYGKCPLPCHIAFNAKFSWRVEQVIDNFWNNQTNQCMYKCMEMKTLRCNEQHKCEANS